jgi:hypothetical protein
LLREEKAPEIKKKMKVSKKAWNTIYALMD